MRPAGRTKIKASAEADAFFNPGNLFRRDEVPATVLMPALLVRVAAERLLFAHAVGGNALRVHTLRNQSLLHSFGTAGSEGEVVFFGSALVAVSFDRERQLRMLLQELRVGGEQLRGLVIDLVGVIGEVCIFYIALKEILKARTGLGHCRRWIVDGQASSRVRNAARTFGKDAISGRLARANRF